MNKQLHLYISPRLLVLFGFLLLLAVGSTRAQDAPSVPGAPDVVSVESSDPGIVLTWWQVIGGVIAAVGAGGLAGAAGVGVLATRLKNDKATMAAFEHLANSLPGWAVHALLDAGKSAVDVGELVIEATDGVDAASKTLTVTDGKMVPGVADAQTIPRVFASGGLYPTPKPPYDITVGRSPSIMHPDE